MYVSVQAITFEQVDMETSFLIWSWILTISRSLDQGQGHLMENGNFATWTSVKLSLTCLRSRSY